MITKLAQLDKESIEAKEALKANERQFQTELGIYLKKVKDNEAELGKVNEALKKAEEKTQT